VSTSSGRVLVVDARVLWGSGIGRHVREVTSRILASGEFAEVVLAGDPNELREWSGGLASATPVRILPLAGGRYAVSAQRDWPRLAATLPARSVVWFPHWDAPYLFAHRPTVVTVHDLIPLRVVEHTSGVKRFLMRTLLRRVTRRADRVVTVSQFTRDDLESHDPTLRGHVRVVCGGGVPTAFAEQAHGELPPGVRAPFLLVVANRKPHKNIELAVEVLARLHARHPELSLVVAGERFPHWANTLAHASELGVGDRVIDVETLDDARLAALYAGAACFLMPSRYEGFGLPVLEAMVSGTPVVVARTTSLPEVAGDAALLADPDDITGFADAVQRILEDPVEADRLRTAGRLRAADYSWDRTAADMMALFRELLP
jgi:glycosyltransferase involved in cell wall biosynthesis